MDIDRDNHILYGERDPQIKIKYSENNFKPRAHTAMIILLCIGIAGIIILGALIGTGEFEESEQKRNSTKPELSSREPELSSREPELSSAEPELSSAEPELSSPEPELSSPEPEQSSPEPAQNDNSSPEPVQSSPEP